ncbi:MAG: YvcK family protein [Actinomycetia bacterium]|nr:YvcK family protein [Actinomycetes bacterium]MCP4087206.1 YvcK family protein [Actinomycetes bacterium]
MTAVVALGGGHGLAASLRAARRFATEITAVVSVADDGGSSGRLRRQLGLAAVGDLRRCIGALAGDSLLAQSLEHRFEGGDLDGHAAGNLLLAGLVETADDLVAGVEEACRLAETVGPVLPATTGAIDLAAHTPDGLVTGQVAVAQQEGVIDRLVTDPSDPPVLPDVTKAIEEADLVLMGPGSLYTSVLAVATIPAVLEALRATEARRVLISNLTPDTFETRGYSVDRHVTSVLAHQVPVDVVLCPPDAAPRQSPVPVALHEISGPGVPGHDAVLLAEALQAFK